MALFTKKTAAGVGVSAFGKHPSYADHLPLDVGDQNPLASRLRQTFYNGGILTRVGDWDAMQKAGRAIGFGHYVLYRETEPGQTGASALLRLWHSWDSLSRADVPMVLAAWAEGVPTGWLLKEGTSVLAAAQDASQKATSLEALTAAVGAAATDLRRRAGETTDSDNHFSHEAAPFLGDASVVAGLRPIQAFLSLDHANLAALPEKGQSARIAALGATPMQSLMIWSAILDAALANRRTRYFLIAPEQGGWVDILIGEISARHFLCLRSGGEAIPPIQPGKDELTDPFGRDALKWLSGLAKLPAKSGNGAIVFIVVVAVILLVLAGVMMMSRHG